MKRVLGVLLALGLFIVPSVSFAAWVITESVYADREGKQVVVKLECTSDADGTDFALTKKSSRVLGMYLYSVRTDPGDGDDVPAGAYALDVEDDLNFHVLDLDGRLTDTIETVSADTTLGIFPPMYYMPSVVIGTLGDGNKTDVYLTFIK